MNRRTALRRSLSKISPVVRVGGKLFAVLLLGIWIGSYFCGTQNMPIHDLSLPPVDFAAVPVLMDQNHPEQNGELKENCVELESMLAAAQKRSQTEYAEQLDYAELLAGCKSLLSMKHTAALKVQSVPHGPAPPPKQPSRLSAPEIIIPEIIISAAFEEEPAADPVEQPADSAGPSLRVGFVRTPTLPPGEHTADDGKLHIIFSTGCNRYQQWQSQLLLASAANVGQRGRITRIVSGCYDHLEGDSDESALKGKHFSKSNNDKQTAIPISELSESTNPNFGLFMTPSFEGNNQIFE